MLYNILGIKLLTTAFRNDKSFFGRSSALDLFPHSHTRSVSLHIKAYLTIWMLKNEE